MSTITKQWLQKKIAEMEVARDEIPFGLDEDDSNTLAALRIALASLEAEPVAYLTNSSSMTEVITSHHFGGNTASMHRCAKNSSWIPLFITQPAPVSVPDAATAIRACMEEFPESVHDIVEECAAIAESACRGAMLNQEKGNG